MPGMNDIITPLSLLITALAGWLNERQNKTIDFLCEPIERTAPGSPVTPTRTVNGASQCCRLVTRA